MIKFHLERAPFLFLVGTILLLPLAHIKADFFGVPLYAPEGCVLGALLTTLWFKRHQWVGSLSLDKFLLAGLGLFLLGAMLSFLGHPLSLTGLGMIKSWFIIPVVFGLLLWPELIHQEQRNIFLLVWFSMLLLVALRSLSFFFEGVLTYDGRLQGDYTSPNFLAFFVASGIVIALYFLVENFERKRALLLKIMVTSGGLSFLVVIFLTRSYGVWLALTLALGVFFGGRLFQGPVSKKGILAVLMLAFVIGSSFLYLEHGSEKWQALMRDDPRSSWSSRLMIWQAALAIARDHPLGIGVGRFQAVYLEYQHSFPPYLEWAVPEPHNFFLALFLSTGGVGLAGFLLIFGRLGVLLRKRVQVGLTRSDQHLLLLLLSLWTVFFVYGLFDTPYFKNDLAYSFFFVLALSFSLIQKTPPLVRERLE